MLRDRAFIFGMGIPYDKAILMVPKHFQHVTLTVTYDLLLKNLNIDHKSYVLRGRAIISGICVP